MSGIGVSMKNYFKMGFGVGAGVFVVQILFVLLGLALAIPGYILIKRGRPEKTITSDTEYYGGMVLLILGVVLMGGIGFGTILENLDF